MPYAQVHGIQLYYDEAGEGDSLLLIMGITAPGSVWEDHAHAWKEHFRCIMPDNRGVGFSDKPAGPYTSAQMADDVAGLLDALDLGAVRVVGLSMGGIIAQQLALRHPERVRAMVLMCTWARCDRYTEGVFRHLMAAKARLRPEEFMAYMQVLIFAKETWDSDEGFADLLVMREEAAQGAYPQPLHGLEAQAYGCTDHDVLADLHRIAVPTLVLAGTDDVFIPAWMTEEVAEGIPGSEIQLYSGAGHAFHFERIDEVNERVAMWLLAH